MTKFVIKKDGSKEDFKPEKIKKSISLACQDAEIDEARTKEVVGQVSSVVLQRAGEKEVIQTSEIRDRILQELETVEPSAAEAWRNYKK